MTLGGGVNGAFGVEWFVRPQISLAAEYRAGITYRWTRDEPDRYRWTPVDSDAR